MHVRQCFDALKCIVQLEKLFFLFLFSMKYHYEWLRSFTRSISTLLQCITQCILDHRNHMQIQIWKGHRLFGVPLQRWKEITGLKWWCICLNHHFFPQQFKVLWIFFVSEIEGQRNSSGTAAKIVYCLCKWPSTWMYTCTVLELNHTSSVRHYIWHFLINWCNHDG